MASLDRVLGQAGITYRQYDYWARKGYLDLPERHPGRGEVTLSRTQERAIVAAGRLHRAGFRPERACELGRVFAEGHIRQASIGAGVTLTLE